MLPLIVFVTYRVVTLKKAYERGRERERVSGRLELYISNYQVQRLLPVLETDLRSAGSWCCTTTWAVLLHVLCFHTVTTKRLPGGFLEASGGFLEAPERQAI